MRHPEILLFTSLH